MDRPASDTPAAAPITAEREAFETWMTANLPGIELHWRESDGGEYMLSHAHVAWRAWKGARLSAPVAAPVPLEFKPWPRETSMMQVAVAPNAAAGPYPTAMRPATAEEVAAMQQRFSAPVAAQPAASGVDAQAEPLNGIPATLRHDEGAYAQCGECGRYTLDPFVLSATPRPCDCGSVHGWSGSFKRPGTDAKWSGEALHLSTTLTVTDGGNG